MRDEGWPSENVVDQSQRCSVRHVGGTAVMVALIYVVKVGCRIRIKLITEPTESIYPEVHHQNRREI